MSQSSTWLSAVIPETINRASTGYQEDKVSITKRFLSGMKFEPTTIHGTNEKLEATMRAEMDALNPLCAQLERSLSCAASLAELGYRDHNFEEKKTVALFTWFLIYIDELAPKNSGPFIAFEERFLRGQPQLDPVLDVFARLLHSLWDTHDPRCTSSIHSATFDFIISTCIEEDVQKLPLVRGAQRFPWFLREKTGIPALYAYLMYPKSRKIDILEYIQAVPDMNLWVCLTNDLLSFHKEEIRGEKSLYVYTRAYVENKAPFQVLAEVADELQTSQNVIAAALANNQEALRLWQIWERGYVEWHLTQARYRLQELGL